MPSRSRRRSPRLVGAHLGAESLRFVVGVITSYFPT
jgi:hypothetical protein